MSERLPRVGDIVWYRCDPASEGRHPMGQMVHAAIVTRVHSHSSVNLTIFPDGATRLTELVGARSRVDFGDMDTPRSWFWRPGEERQTPAQPGPGDDPIFGGLHDPEGGR